MKTRPKGFIEEYHGHKYRQKDRSDKQKATDKAWSLLCQIEYLLQEMDSKNPNIPKHMLDMTFQHIRREIHDIYNYIAERN